MLKQLLCGLVVVAVSGGAWSGAAQPSTSVPRDPAAPGYLEFSKRHPDGLEGPDEFDRGFTADAALERLEQVRGFLNSFRQLTNQVRGQLAQSELQQAGNTAPVMQTIGFHNIPLVIEGTLRKQEYQLAQARYELAQLKHTRGAVNDEDLASARSAFVEAARRFQAFWDTRRPID
jgi:hypothetical protein